MPNSLITTGTAPDKMFLADAITSLNANDPAHWTKAGLMDLNVLKELTGRRVTREEADEVSAGLPPVASPAADSPESTQSANVMDGSSHATQSKDLHLQNETQPGDWNFTPGRRDSKKSSKGVQAGTLGQPAGAYRNGPNGTIETTKFATGFIPEGWFPTPAGLENFKGWKNTTVVDVRRQPDGEWV